MGEASTSSEKVVTSIIRASFPVLVMVRRRTSAFHSGETHISRLVCISPSRRMKVARSGEN